MQFNVPGFEDRFAIMAQTVGAPHGNAEGFISWLKQLKQDIGIPKTLSEVGVKREHVGKLVDFAVADGCHQNNPRVVGRADFEKLFTEALGA